MPNKKPHHLKLLQGTDRPSRKRRQPRPPGTFQPSPPAWLPRYAKMFWRAYAPKLEEVGILSPADRAAFELLCLLHHRIRTCNELLDAEGLVVKGYRGGTVKHPAISILTAAEKEFRLLAGDFGLHPAGRGRLDIPIERDSIEDESFFAMRKLYEGD